MEGRVSLGGIDSLAFSATGELSGLQYLEVGVRIIDMLGHEQGQGQGDEGPSSVTIDRQTKCITLVGQHSLERQTILPRGAICNHWDKGT